MRSGAKIMCRISAGRRSNCDGSAAVSSSLAGVGIVEVLWPRSKNVAMLQGSEDKSMVLEATAVGY